MIRQNLLLSPTANLFQIAVLSWVICANLKNQHSEIIYPNHHMLFTTYPNHCTPSSTMEFRKYHTVSLSKQCAVLLTHKYPLSTKYLSSIKNFSSYILLIVIATSCDIELNPGPCNVKYPCGTCGKAATWRQKGIRCDNSDCEQWYHIDCQNMRPSIYDNMNSSGCIWECYKCALPNFSSSLFDLHSVSTSNSYSILDSTTEDSQEILSPGLPLASSSPNKRIPKKQAQSFEATTNFKC